MARVSYIEEQDHPELAAEIGKIKGGRGSLINIYKLLLHTPTVCMTWLAHIGANDLHEHAIRLAGLEQFHDRNAQSFFENLPRFGRKNAPANIGAVAGIREQRRQFALAKNRRRNRDVVDLTRGLPWIVGNQHISGREPFRRERRQEMFH